MQFNILSKGVHNKVINFVIDAKLLQVNQDEEKNFKIFSNNYRLN